MPMYLSERVESRVWTRMQTDLVYILEGTSDDVLAQMAVMNSTALTYAGRIRQTPIDLDPVWVDTVADDGLWVCTVHYVVPEVAQSEIGTQVFSYETGGGTEHITQSLATVGSFGLAGDFAPDFHGAIGVTDDAVEGVDIETPAFQFTVTRVYEAGQQPTPEVLFNLTDHVNSDPFVVMDTQRGDSMTLAAGTTRFRGASVSAGVRSDGGVEISFSFEAIPNIENRTIGQITGINKKGQEYLWVRYENRTDTVSKRLVKRPIAAYAERVYENGDFTGLKILSSIPE
jgi:hypothetical protein